MITVAVWKRGDGILELRARFHDEESGTVGDGFQELHPGEEYLGIPYDRWDHHRDSLVAVGEDGTLSRRRTRDDPRPAPNPPGQGSSPFLGGILASLTGRMGIEGRGGWRRAISSR